MQRNMNRGNFALHKTYLRRVGTRSVSCGFKREGRAKPAVAFAARPMVSLG
jgi:hypothetical protein